MLDAKGTFDDLVARYSQSGEQADRILQNRLYRNLTSALSGTQEYMAMEKLYELHSEGGFDLVVVDTPPTRHALDFVDAPRRLYSFLENRVFRLVLMPTRAYLKAMTFAAQCAVAHDLPGRRLGDRRGRDGLLPRLRRHGGGLPGTGTPCRGPARESGHGLRARGGAARGLDRRGARSSPGASRRARYR